MSWKRVILGAAEINSPCNISVKLVNGIFDNTVLYSESVHLLKTCCFSPLQYRISVYPMAHLWTLLAQPPPHLSSTDCSWMMTWMEKLETSLLLLMIPKNTCAQWRHISHTGLQQRYKAMFSFPSTFFFGELFFRACSGHPCLALYFLILRTRT